MYLDAEENHGAQQLVEGLETLHYDSDSLMLELQRQGKCLKRDQPTTLRTYAPYHRKHTSSNV